MTKRGELKSIAHNIADSLSSGIGIPIGIWMTDIYAEALSSPEGYIEVDFLKGASTGGTASESLLGAIRAYKDYLPGLCGQHHVDSSIFKKLSTRYYVHQVYGHQFTVEVETSHGISMIESYDGSNGRKLFRRRI